MGVRALIVSSIVYIASSITCAILKAIRAGVGFGSGTETSALTVLWFSRLLTDKDRAVLNFFIWGGKLLESLGN